MEKKLFVVLGDVVSSRKIVDRDDFELRVEQACDLVNTKYNKHLYTNFKILKGLDEIGGVLRDISDIYDIIVLIEDCIYPQHMRFVSVLGFINTGLDTNDISKMDGPAFHIAADCISELGKTKLLFKLLTGNRMTDEAIEGQINLLLLLSDYWKPKQRKVIGEYRKLGSHTDVADSLGTTRQNVSNMLEKIKWKQIEEIEGNLRYLLHRYNKDISRRCQIDQSNNDRDTIGSG